MAEAFYFMEMPVSESGKSSIKQRVDFVKEFLLWQVRLPQAFYPSLTSRLTFTIQGVVLAV